MSLQLTGLSEMAAIQLWQVSLVALVVGGLALLVGRKRPQLAYLLWMLIIIKSLVPPVFASPGSAFSYLAAPPALSAGSPSPVAVASQQVSRRPPLEQLKPDEISRAGAIAVEQRTAPGGSTRWATRFCLITWLAGVFAASALATARYLRLVYRLRDRCQGAEARLKQTFDELVTEAGFWRLPQLKVVKRAIGPLAIPLLRPTVVLPWRVADTLSERQIRLILAHELHHIRRGDLLASLLQLVSQILWWFHPLIWWVHRRATQERERCCDEAVLVSTGSTAEQYAQSLLDTLRLQREISPVPAFPGVRAFDVTRRRLEHIMQTKTRFQSTTPRWNWLVLLAGLAFLVPGATGGPEGGDRNATDVTHVGLPFSKWPKAELEAGSRSIWGRCVDAEGRGLAGVSVALVHFDGRSGKESVVNVITTDAGGTFAFEHLPDFDRQDLGWNYYWIVAHDEWRASAITGLPSRSSRRKLELTMPEPITVRGRVTDAEGKPVEGALVRFDTLMRPLPGIHSAKTDEHGRYAIYDLAAYDVQDHVVDRGGGSWEVPAPFFRVEHPDFARTRVGYQQIPGRFDITLQPAATLAGQVIYSETGEPAANVTVRYQSLTRPVAGHHRDFGVAITDAEGRYRFTSLGADQYNIWAEADNWTVKALDSVAVQPGQENAVPELKLIRGGWVKGQLVDARTGETAALRPDERVRVGAYGPSKPRSGGAIDGTVVAPDGTFQLRLAPGTNHVYVSGTGPFSVVGERRGEQDVVIREGQTDEIVFFVERAGQN